MNLWIRSQDKERLMKVNYIDLFYDEKIEENDEYRLYSYVDNSTQYLLGIYETKERALQVLDEIFKIIENASSPYNEVFLTSAVYQMPKE